MHLVDDLGAAAQALGQSLSQLEAEVEPAGADVKQQVARRRHRSVARAGELAERMQPHGTRITPQPIPQAGSDPHHTRQLRLGYPESHRALEPRDVRERVSKLCV